MLIIYSGLSLGGIETFWVRLAKQRFLEGQNTKIILYTPLKFGNYNKELLQQLAEYAEVYYFNDIFSKLKLNWRFYFFHELKLEKLHNIVNDCSQIHVADAFSGLLANKILYELKLSKPITFGVYHTKEFTWGASEKLPYFEQVNRRFVFELNPNDNLLCYSKTTKETIEKKIGFRLENAKTFRLGVIEKPIEKVKVFSLNSTIKICAIGRLTSFKTYNFWMPKVIKELKEKGLNVTFDIYGSGECESDIKRIVSEYPDYISLQPAFNYSEFSKIVSNYDLFIGSGTAIIEAASLGIPSIIGIESIEEPLSYGFFSEFADYEYHVLGLPFKLKPVVDIIYEFCLSDCKAKEKLSIEHKRESKFFLMSTCSYNFESMQIINTPKIKFNPLFYTLSRLFFYKKIGYLGKTIYNDF